MYTMENWNADGVFKATPGQEISEEIYYEMLGAVPAYSIPRKTSSICLNKYDLVIHGGFLMGEPQTHDRDGEPLYHVFVYNYFGKKVGEKHYYYGGLSRAQKEINGDYYLFDCLGLIYDDPELPCSNLIPVSLFEDEKTAIKQAANYEAELFFCSFKNDEEIEHKCLYNPWGDE